MPDFKKGDIFYYTRIMPTIGIYDLLEVKVRGIYDTYFVATEKREKQAFLFSYSEIDKTVFKNRDIALEVINKAEKNKKNISMETYYEED